MNNTKKSALKMIAVIIVAGILGLIMSTIGQTALSFLGSPLPLCWISLATNW